MDNFLLRTFQQQQEQLCVIPQSNDTSSIVLSPDGNSILIPIGYAEKATTGAGEPTQNDDDKNNAGGLTEGINTHCNDNSNATNNNDYIRNGCAKMYNIRNGRTIQSFCNGHTDYIHAASFSDDGKILATASKDNTIRLWDVQTGSVMKTFHTEDGDGSIKFVIITSSSEEDDNNSAQHVVSGSLVTEGMWEPENLLITTWDIASGKKTGTYIPNIMDEEFVSVAFSSDGEKVYIGSLYGSIHMYHLDHHHHGNNKNTAVAESAKKAEITLAALLESTTTTRVTEDNKPRIIQPKKDAFEDGHDNGVWSMSLTKDDQFIVSGSGDATAILWDARNGRKIRTFRGGHDKLILAAHISGDGRFVVTGCEDGIITYWDAQTGKIIWINTRAHPGREISALTMSFDGMFVVSQPNDGHIKFWGTTPKSCFDYRLDNMYGRQKLLKTFTKITAATTSTNLRREEDENENNDNNSDMNIPSSLWPHVFSKLNNKFEFLYYYVSAKPDLFQQSDSTLSSSSSSSISSYNSSSSCGIRSEKRARLL